MVEILLAWVLTWFHVDFAAAAAGVVAYRLFNFWLALVPAAAVLPFIVASSKSSSMQPRRGQAADRQPTGLAQ